MNGLKQIFRERCINVAEFAKRIGVPKTTLYNALNYSADVGRMGIDLYLKICAELNEDPRGPPRGTAARCGDFHAAGVAQVPPRRRVGGLRRARARAQAERRDALVGAPPRRVRLRRRDAPRAAP